MVKKCGHRICVCRKMLHQPRIANVTNGQKSYDYVFTDTDNDKKKTSGMRSKLTLLKKIQLTNYSTSFKV